MFGGRQEQEAHWEMTGARRFAMERKSGMSVSVSMIICCRLVLGVYEITKYGTSISP